MVRTLGTGCGGIQQQRELGSWMAGDFVRLIGLGSWTCLVSEYVCRSCHCALRALGGGVQQQARLFWILVEVEFLGIGF